MRNWTTIMTKEKEEEEGGKGNNRICLCTYLRIEV
jgi:hypothetical protein